MDNIEYATIKEKCIDLEISYFRCSDQDPILFLGKVTEPLPFKNYMIVNLWLLPWQAGSLPLVPPEKPICFLQLNS